MLSAKDIITDYGEFFKDYANVLDHQLISCVELIKNRLEVLTDIHKEMKVFIEDPKTYDEKSIKRISKLNIKEIGAYLISMVEEDLENLKENISSKANELDLGMGNFLQVLRVAVVGSLSGPDLIPLIKLVGKDVTLRRLKRLMNS